MAYQIQVPNVLYENILRLFDHHLDESGSIKDAKSWETQEVRLVVEEIVSQAHAISKQGGDHCFTYVTDCVGVIKGYTDLNAETDGNIGIPLVNLAGALLMIEWIIDNASGYPVATPTIAPSIRQVYTNVQHLYKCYVDPITGEHKIEGNSYKHDFLPWSMGLCFFAVQVAQNDEGFVADHLRKLIENYLSGLGSDKVYPTVRAFNSPFYDHLAAMVGATLYLQYGKGSARIKPL